EMVINQHKGPVEFKKCLFQIVSHSFHHQPSFFCLSLQTVQIMIGLLTLLFGIAAAVYYPSLGTYSGFFVWGALIVSPVFMFLCLQVIIASLTLNIIAALVAVSGVILYALDSVFGQYYHHYHHYILTKFSLQFYYGGFSAVVAVFQFLEFIISITMAAFACNATCSCCCHTEVRGTNGWGPHPAPHPQLPTQHAGTAAPWALGQGMRSSTKLGHIQFEDSV
uniref:Uncharacterized protein n=1 Tax=Salarias fasciatus TaxID=181472 RepID=A0A672HM42_SALFA